MAFVMQEASLPRHPVFSSRWNPGERAKHHFCRSDLMNRPFGLSLSCKESPCGFSQRALKAGLRMFLSFSCGWIKPGLARFAWIYSRFPKAQQYISPPKCNASLGVSQSTVTCSFEARRSYSTCGSTLESCTQRGRGGGEEKLDLQFYFDSTQSLVYGNLCRFSSVCSR